MTVKVGEFLRDVIVFDVPSDTHDDITYEVTIGDGFGRCTCPDYHYRATLPRNKGLPAQSACKHLDEAYGEWYDIVTARRAEHSQERTVTIHVPLGVKVEVA